LIFCCFFKLACVNVRRLIVWQVKVWFQNRRMKWKRTKGGYEGAERRQSVNRRKKPETTKGNTPGGEQTSAGWKHLPQPATYSAQTFTADKIGEINSDWKKAGER